jgi:hypothetical protein
MNFYSDLKEYPIGVYTTLAALSIGIEGNLAGLFHDDSVTESATEVAEGLPCSPATMVAHRFSAGLTFTEVAEIALDWSGLATSMESRRAICSSIQPWGWADRAEFPRLTCYLQGKQMRGDQRPGL